MRFFVSAFALLIALTSLGADQIGYGTKGTAGRYYAWPMCVTGQWVRLDVPAKAVSLENTNVVGMGGRATWDKIGKASSITKP